MFDMPILVSRASDSAKNVLVSRKHGVAERRFETVLRQFRQCPLPKSIQNKCSTCQFWFLELQILPKTCLFLESMAYVNVTLKLFFANFFNAFLKKAFKINVLDAKFSFSRFRFCPKHVVFLSAWRTRKSLWDCYELTTTWSKKKRCSLMSNKLAENNFSFVGQNTCSCRFSCCFACAKKLSLELHFLLKACW